MKKVLLLLGKEKQRKGDFLVKYRFNNDREYFALSHFIFTNQKQVFVSVSSIVKFVNVVN